MARGKESSGTGLGAVLLDGLFFQMNKNSNHVTQRGFFFFLGMLRYKVNYAAGVAHPFSKRKINESC